MLAEKPLQDLEEHLAHPGGVLHVGPPARHRILDAVEHIGDLIETDRPALPVCQDDGFEAVRALERVSEIDEAACNARVKRCFSIETMVAAYERVYSTIFEMEAKKVT